MKKIVPSVGSTREFFTSPGAGQYWVSISHGSKITTKKWNAEKVLALDYPPTLFLIKDDEGIRVVNRVLDGPVEKEEQLAAFSEPLIPGKAGAETEVGDFDGESLRLQIARIQRPRATSLPLISGSTNPYLTNDAVRVTCGVHDQFSTFEGVGAGGTFAGQVNGNRVFKLRRTSTGVYLSALAPGVNYKLKGAARLPLSEFGHVIVQDSDLRSLRISFGDYWWKFSSSKSPGYSKIAHIRRKDRDLGFFKKSTWAITSIIAFVVGVGALAPMVSKKETPFTDVYTEASRIQLRKPKVILPVARVKSQKPKVAVQPTQAGVKRNLRVTIGTQAGKDKVGRLLASLSTSQIGMSGKGSLNPVLVSGVLESNLAYFKRCYEGYLNMKPNASGTVTLQWTVNGMGLVSGEEVIRAGFGSSSFFSCLTQELKRMKFDGAQGGAVVLKAPFHFSIVSD